MLENELRKEYFEWLYYLVCDKRFSEQNSYRKLLRVNNYKQNIQTVTAKQEYSNLENYIGNYALDLSALYKTFKSEEIPSPKDVHYEVVLKNFPPDVIENMQRDKNVI